MKKLSVMIALTAGLLSFASSANAQVSFGVGVGFNVGHTRVAVGVREYGRPYYGPRYVYRAPVLVAPAPMVEERVIVEQPEYTYDGPEIVYDEVPTPQYQRVYDYRTGSYVLVQVGTYMRPVPRQVEVLWSRTYGCYGYYNNNVFFGWHAGERRFHRWEPGRSWR